MSAQCVTKSVSVKIEFPKQVFCQFAILFRDLTRTKPRTVTGTMGINNDGVDCYHQVDGEKVVLTVENDVTSEVGSMKIMVIFVPIKYSIMKMICTSF